MCRLLGMVANKEVDLEFSLGKFKKLAYNNPDGWGIGWYENSSAKIFKKAISATDDSNFHSLSKEVRSKFIIAHVRKGTCGKRSELNSHPFQYENWIFAHNGYVDRDSLLKQLRQEYKNYIKGNTDSEVYFYLIMQCIEDANNDVIAGIKEAVKKVTSSNYTGLNFLLSDEKCLYAFRYSISSKDYYSLWLLKRDPSESGPIEFYSQETGALLKSKTLKSEKAVLVCSEKLTEEEWKEVNPGSLIIIESDLSMKEIGVF